MDTKILLNRLVDGNDLSQKEASFLLERVIAGELNPIQSAAFLVTFTYYYDRFYLQPQLYLDYYLPEISEKRLTSLFSVTAGFSFY